MEGTRPDLEIQYVRGFPFPSRRLFKEDLIMSALDYSPRNDDVFVCSFPKTGTTWTQYIVMQILHRMKVYPSFDDLLYQDAPYVELAGAAAAERLPPPRLLKFHLPYSLIPKNSGTKYIYTIRNPKDTVVSYYFFSRALYGHTLSFEDYFVRFMAGTISYGDYFDHVLSWYEHKDDKNCLMVHYEDLCKDTRSQILRIAEFLGQEHFKAIEEDSGLMDGILKNTNFKNMKSSLSLDITKKEGSKDTEAKGKDTEAKGGNVNFFRKGKSGDWRNHLTPEQSCLMDKKIREKLGHTDLISKWKKIME